MDRKFSSSSLSKSPKFFKIVVNPEDDKLRFPTGFIRKYGRNLPDKVTLKAPNGTVRQIELVQLDGETWLYNGWEEFKESYEISIGHLLVFVYDGESHFDVFIFDMTALEIEYPLDYQVSESEVHESESDDSAGILKQAVHKTKQRKRPCNNGEGKCREVKGLVCKKRTTPIMDKQTCAAYRRAKAFKTNNPFCICFIHPSYVSSGSIRIPVAFARKHVPEPKHQLRLHLLKKGTWTMTCSVEPQKAKINNGWGKFVRDNALKVGDACVFEVNKRVNLLWNVTIFRG